ncbi:DUF4294 domain-containing protein [soil metagenome]
MKIFNMIRAITLLLLLVAGATIQAQDTTGYMVGQITPEGDTLFLASLDPVTILDRRQFKNDLDKSNFRKLQRNLAIVYPYAKMAKEIYAGMQEDMSQIDKRRQQKKYKKVREEELKAEFEEKLKNLNTTQGKLLIMLVNRYTGNNCYGLIKELKGGIAAFSWNIVGKRWGYDLKEPYVAANNPDIEWIMKALEEEDRKKQQ